MTFRIRTLTLQRQKESLKKQLELSNRSEKLVSEFLAQMSHEIRTPINTVLSYMSLIKERISEENIEGFGELFDPVERSGIRIVRTIDMILNMSEIQAGTFERIKIFMISIRTFLKVLFLS